MLLKDLEKGEKFTYEIEHNPKWGPWIHNGYIPYHPNTIDCIEVKSGRHRPFKDTVEVNPEQQRIPEYSWDPAFRYCSPEGGKK